MKSVFILSFILICVPLISAWDSSYYADKNRVDIFGPLNENVQPILFQGMSAVYYDILNNSLKLDWPDKKRFLLEFHHSYDKNYVPAIQIKKDSTKKDASQKNKFLNDIYIRFKENLNRISDYQILFQRGIEYNEKIHKLVDFSPKHYNKHEYLKFVKFVSRSGLELYHLHINIRYLMNSRYNDDLPTLLSNMQDSVCEAKMSLQQMLSNFLGHHALAGAQKLLTIRFAQEMIAFAKGENVDEHYMKYFERDVQDYYHKSFNIMKTLISNSSREVWRCDPTNHIEDVTYIKLDKAFQEYSDREQASNCHVYYQPICHNLSDSDRYFNLQPVYSNVYNNSVITGVRIVKKNHVLHIQIQEGQLLPNGVINASSIIWVPINENTSCKNCFVLKWDGSRSIDLNDVVLPNNSNEVLTGISFDNIKNNTEDRLRLGIYSTPFNFTTGKLILIDHEYPWKVQYPEPSSIESNINNRRTSNLRDKENVAAARKDQIIFSTATNKKDDETIIPYIDIQPIETIPPSPMAGAGLFYKNSTSGFLAMKLFTYNMTSFLKT